MIVFYLRDRLSWQELVRQILYSQVELGASCLMEDGRRLFTLMNQNIQDCFFILLMVDGSGSKGLAGGDPGFNGWISKGILLSFWL